MLRPLRPEEFESCAEWAWSLTQAPHRCGYPIYTDGVKTKADFLALARRAQADPHAGILLYTQNGVAVGWLQYVHLPQDSYLSLDACCVAADTAGALAAFLAFARQRFGGCQLVLGFPADNTDATGFLRGAGFTLAERLYNHSLHCPPPPAAPLPAGVRRVTPDNFAEFRRLHARVETDMYWNSDRLLPRLADWVLLLYGAPATGYVMLTDAGPLADGPVWEIFHLQPPTLASAAAPKSAAPLADTAAPQGAASDGAPTEGLPSLPSPPPDAACQALLQGAVAAATAAGARHVIYLCEQELCPLLAAAGFTPVGVYECWTTQL